MLPPWRRANLPKGLKPFLGLLAFSFLLVQTLFGALFAGVPALLFQRHWWPAFSRYLAGKFSPNESAIVLFLFGGIGLVFFAFGAAMFLSGARSLLRLFTGGIDDFLDLQQASHRATMARLRARPRSTPAAKSTPSSSLFVTHSSNGVFRVSTRSFYRMATVIAFGFTTFWNGVIGFGLVDLARGGSLGLLLSLFLVPFVLVGLGLFALIIYLFLASLHPSMELRLEKEEFQRGETLVLNWSFEHNPSHLRHFDVSLQVLETLIEGSGDDETRYSHQLCEVTIAAQVPLRFQKEGTIRATLPVQPEPSSASSQREVSWILYLHATATRAPDLRFWLPLTVR